MNFDTLRYANTERLQVFPGHGEEWSANDWMVAVTGEVGELASKLKRIRRGVVVRGKDIPSVDDLAEEMADIVIYLDLLAWYHGIDLGDAVRDKFNLVSREINVPIFIDDLT